MSEHEWLFLVFSYIAGSIPTGFLVYWLKEKDDVRKSGSGSTGATNILRTCGGKAAFVTLLLDIIKGAVPVFYGLIHFKNPVIVIAGGAIAVTGHIFPVWLKFKGGKGVATFAGVFFAFMFSADGLLIFPFFALFFIGFLFLTGFVSASSIAGITAAFFMTLFTNIAEVSIIVAAVSILIVFRHRSNIARIRSGEESRLFGRGNG